MTQWESNYNDVHNYIIAHNCGISDIPDDAVTSTGKSMRNWLKEQHFIYYRSDNEQKISKKSRQLLKAIGIEQYRNKYDTNFYNALEDIKLFYEQNHNLCLPRDLVGEKSGVNLFMWLHNQRSRYNRGALKPEYVQMIKESGVTEFLESPFETAVRHLKEYKQANGDYNVSENYICEDGFELGKWCSNICDRYRKGRVLEDQISTLNEIGFAWNKERKNSHEPDFDAMCFGDKMLLPDVKLQYKFRVGLAHATAYYEQNHNLAVTRSYVDKYGYPLGNWFFVQRRKYRQGKIPNEIIKYLEDMGFAWSTNYGKRRTYKLRQKNLDGIATARKYYQKNGHIFVVHDYVDDDGFELGKWLVNMRGLYVNGKLNDEVKTALEELNFYFDINEEYWQDCYRSGMLYMQGNEIKTIPKDLKGVISAKGNSVYSWYLKSRGAYGKDVLDPEKKKKFQELLDLAKKKMSAYKEQHEKKHTYRIISVRDDCYEMLVSMANDAGCRSVAEYLKSMAEGVQ